MSNLCAKINCALQEVLVIAFKTSEKFTIPLWAPFFSVLYISRFQEPFLYRCVKGIIHTYIYFSACVPPDWDNKGKYLNKSVDFVTALHPCSITLSQIKWYQVSISFQTWRLICVDKCFQSFIWRNRHVFSHHSFLLGILTYRLKALFSLGWKQRCLFSSGFIRMSTGSLQKYMKPVFALKVEQCLGIAGKCICSVKCI